MKTKSMIAPGLALALALVAGAAMPGAAKDKPAAAQAENYKLSKPVREAAAAAQTALAAKDNATAAAKLAEAKAAQSTEDDRYIVSSLQLQLAQSTNDTRSRDEAIAYLVTSPRTDAATKNQMHRILAQNAMTAGNWALAEREIQAAIDGGDADTTLVPALVQAKSKLGKTAEGLTLFQQQIAKAKASGQPVPADWYSRAVAMGYDAKLQQPTVDLSYDWLAAAPTRRNWRDAVKIWAELNRAEGDVQTDAFRLMRAAGALNGQGDYVEYAENVYLRAPNEAKTLLDEGRAAGFVKTDKSGGSAGEIYAAASGRVVADKASLAKSATAAKAPAGTFKSAVATADAYVSYGDYAPAIELYRAAIGKPGADAGLANLRLGRALFLAGQKDAAKQAFASVSGPRAGLARYWTVLIDHPATA